MAGRMYVTPWGRNAIAAYIEGGQPALSQRVPDGHFLSVSARSARGPWIVTVHHNGAEVFRAEPRAADFPAAIERAVGTVWP